MTRPHDINWSLVIVGIVATAAFLWLGGVIVTFTCWIVWGIAYEAGRDRGKIDGWQACENARRQP